MSNRKPLTTRQRERLRYMLDNQYTYRSMAEYMNVCTDTLKRILVREGMAEFDGAKYAISPRRDGANTWIKPCMRCKDETPRPKWQYICDKCKENSDTSGVPDSWWESL